VLEAVLFDWGGTLAEWTWSDELHDAGQAAGLAAIGRPASPERTQQFRDELLPLVEEGDYREIVRGWLAPVTDEELDRFLAAEYHAWRPAHGLASTTHALLEVLRERGYKLGLVSNGFDPPDLVREELARLGVAQLLDVIVLSADVGVRKPDPAIFRRALDALGVAPENALFVGDTLATDIAGAAALGMRTCQALWFVADADEGPEPDFRAFTQMDVLTACLKIGEKSSLARSTTPGPQSGA
jgi:putative hydrolase of the HAD superfamily